MDFANGSDKINHVKHMKYSNLTGKTRKEAPKDETSFNARLLIRAGFIEKEMAGVYAFLPMGWTVMNKIMQIIREEMERIGGLEIYLGALQNPETWELTGRWDESVIDVWFKTKLQTGTEVGLATTHEEPLTKIMTHQIRSYKDLPQYVFQFQTKFRNELRSRSGLLRTREFIMKDLYSFDLNRETHEKFYEECKKAYLKIFDRIGIGDQTFVTFASGGPFSKYSHEFQTVCDYGEDTVYVDRNKKLAVNKEVFTDEVLSDLGLKKENMEEVTATEVGNIFNLGTKYSNALGLLYTNEKGEQEPVYMGSYGIGPARVMATIVELYNDENGLIWPENIAPYKAHLAGLNLDNENVLKQAQNIYEVLLTSNVEVLYDDRPDVSPGQKFSDADLIGCPYRLVVSEKTGDQVEVKKRKESKSILVPLNKAIDLLKN